MRISIIGAGYVGLCTGLDLAQRGHHVIMVDNNPQRIEEVLAGRAPFHEPGLQGALREALRSSRLDATADIADSVAATDVTFICVGTPPDAHGRMDISFVLEATKAVAACSQHKRSRHGIIIKSTVLPGTLERLRPVAGDCWVASNPEFLKEGTAMDDARNPDRIVVGCEDDEGRAFLDKLYIEHGCPVIHVSPTAAEMAKYTANSMLAARISMVNEMANICESIGVDWYDVAAGIKDDPRIGGLFLRPGVGFGGSCFPKDVLALHHLAEDVQEPSLILDATLARNDLQPLRAVGRVEQRLGGLEGKRIAVLGLAFKPDTDDVRGTRALPIVERLSQAGAVVVLHDPVAGESFRQACGLGMLADSIEAALDGADAVIIQTEWSAYRDISAATFTRMRRPLIIDGRRTLDAAALRAAGIEYHAIGDGRPSPMRVEVNA